MGWASGSIILEDIWREVREFIPEPKRANIFEKLAKVMWDGDCDTLDELISNEWPEVEQGLIQLGYLDKDWRDDCSFSVSYGLTLR